MTLRSTTIAAAILAAGAASGQEGIEILALDEMGLAAHPSLRGVEGAMVAGAFDAPGFYAANSVMREGAVFPPHAHPDDRLSLVVSGTMHLGTGPMVDPASERAVPAGSAALTPAGTTHYMVAREGDVRILEIGAGPSATNFPGPPATD